MISVEIEEIKQRLTALEEKQRKIIKERELSLKDKFDIHDRAQGLVRWFEEITGGVASQDVWIGNYLNGKKTSVKDLKEIVRGLSRLVDNALGVKFP